ncbi:sortase-dependent protein [Streptomyces sp. NPDC051133]|uniref:sortase-dependent protein n=1 Tax=Streptomyces sp. NPDC051133 TaxID=3155521 RepID=UPI003447EACA
MANQLTSRRAARTVRMLGGASVSAALAIGAAGTAFASSISDFSAAAECDGGKGVLIVTDKDASHARATVSVFLEQYGADAKRVAVRKVKGSRTGTTLTIAEHWQSRAVYRIRVKAGKIDADIQPNLTTPSRACKKKDPAPARPRSASAVPAAAPRSSTSIPGAAHRLAATGVDAPTDVAAGIAAALAVMGSAAVFYSLRRR